MWRADDKQATRLVTHTTPLTSDGTRHRKDTHIFWCASRRNADASSFSLPLQVLRETLERTTEAISTNRWSNEHSDSSRTRRRCGKETSTGDLTVPFLSRPRQLSNVGRYSLENLREMRRRISRVWPGGSSLIHCANLRQQRQKR